MFLKTRRWQNIIRIQKKSFILKHFYLYNILYIYILKNIKFKNKLQIFLKKIFFKKKNFNLKNINICLKTNKFKKLFNFIQLNRNILKKKILNDQIPNIKNFVW